MKKKYYYVYCITNLLDGKIYIGCHGTNDLEDGYMGSSKYLTADIRDLGKETFTKEILFHCKTKKEMLSKERELVHKDFVLNENTYNKIVGGNNSTEGFVCVKDVDCNVDFVSVDDPRYLSGELIPITTGKTTVKDKYGNYSHVDITDVDYVNKELIPVTKGRVVVKDIEGNYHQVSITDPRYLSGELVPIWTGKKHSIETKRKIGLANSIHQRGKNHNQYGTCWVYSEELHKNKKIKKEDLDNFLQDNTSWKKGRNMQFYN